MACRQFPFRGCNFNLPRLSSSLALSSGGGSSLVRERHIFSPGKVPNPLRGLGTSLVRLLTLHSQRLQPPSFSLTILCAWAVEPGDWDKWYDM
jgi:hypothetical protein